MPTGKVKWFDPAKGFGFLSSDEGADVYVHVDALPDGVDILKPGQRVEFGIAQGRRGDQALQVRLLEHAKPVSRKQAESRRKKPDEMAIIIEDVIRALDDLGDAYRHGHQPEARKTKPVAQVLRGLAAELD